ncbi:rhomboid family-domain-containing protein [Phycomyces blakesleeanus]
MFGRDNPNNQDNPNRSQASPALAAQAVNPNNSPHVQFAANSPTVMPSQYPSPSPSVNHHGFQAPFSASESSSPSQNRIGSPVPESRPSEKTPQDSQTALLLDNGNGIDGGNELHKRSVGQPDSIAMNNMPRADGFSRLDSNQSPQPHQYQQQQHQQQYPYQYSQYQYPPPPPQGNGPYIHPQQLARPLPHGYNRSVWLRLLIGPVRKPWFSWLSALAMLGALIYEFVRNYQLTSSVIETSPFNPMIGPSSTVLINVGARFTPCMRALPAYTASTVFGGCYQSTDATCTLEELCGFGGFESGIPDQSFRFVLPIFLHAGIVHFLMNMLTHLRLGIDIEREIGLPRYVLLYMGSGIWGFVLSAMLSQGKSASMGCSGALFGLIGYTLVDIIINWKTNPDICRELSTLFVSIIVSLVLGLLPGLDNFAHIGGFAVGIMMGILLVSIRRKASTTTKGVRWVLRGIAAALLVVMFVVTIRQFYASADPSQICPNCKYLSCLPVRDWCDSS